MFNLKIASLGEVRPPGDYHFKWEGHIEEYTGMIGLAQIYIRYITLAI